MFDVTPPPTRAATDRPPPWRVLVVDDEPEVHIITRLALRDCEFRERPVEFVSAMNAEEARAAFAAHPDLALAFIDVVMETDHAGLDLVTFIRQGLGNEAVRLILRTGQPGAAPEREVVRDFDIDDYLAKTSITAGKLYTVTISGLRSYARIVTLQRGQQQLQRHRDGLQALVDASVALFDARSLRQMAQGLLQHLGSLLHGSGPSGLARSGAVAVTRTANGYDLLAKAGRFNTPAAAPLEPEALARLEACLERRACLFADDVFVGYFPGRLGQVDLAYIDGVDRPDALGEQLLDQFTRHIALAFDKLHREREWLDTGVEIIAMLVDLLQARTMGGLHHGLRVAHLSRLLGQALNLSDDDCRTLFTVSPLYDIGKFALPDDLLRKPGPLTDEEWALMRRHAQIGADVLARSDRPVLQVAAQVACQHHERHDGGGYPQGLQGDEIHLFARIVAVVDVFDALVHRRGHKPAWPLPRVLAALRAGRGRSFDPQVIDGLLDRLDEALEILERFPGDRLPDTAGHRSASRGATPVEPS